MIPHSICYYVFSVNILSVMFFPHMFYLDLETIWEGRCHFYFSQMRTLCLKDLPEITLVGNARAETRIYTWSESWGFFTGIMHILLKPVCSIYVHFFFFPHGSVCHILIISWVNFSVLHPAIFSLFGIPPSHIIFLDKFQPPLYKYTILN